ncbi:MAG TPA: hypothetical protein VEF04_12965 [Blastocatellia bacterium]|nr:hypothetical protein [Blastocatellia bacterium]
MATALAVETKQAAHSAKTMFFNKRGERKCLAKSMRDDVEELQRVVKDAERFDFGTARKMNNVLIRLQAKLDQLEDLA